LRKLLVAAAVLATVSSAQAADMTVKAPLRKAPVAQVYDWTGFYIGVNAGVSVGRDLTELRVIGTADRSHLSPFGAVGGVQAGYNWQINKDWLIGAEADFQASGERDSFTCLLSCTALSATRFDQQIDWFGTARVRVGRVDGPVLSYVTGGLAYGHFSTTLTETLPQPVPGAAALPPVTAAFSANHNRLGYTFGSGLEASLGGNWTGKIEHLYVDLGSRTYNFALNGLPQVLTTRLRDHIFRGGVNYRFGALGNYAPPATANWTGFYLGGNAGSVLGRNPSSLNTAATGFADTLHLVPVGYSGGGQVGYNWQSGAWVFGVEADFQGAFAEDKDACVSNCGTATQIALKQTLPWFGTARGRIGYSVGSTLFYATGGYAYGETRTSLASIAPAPSFVFTHRRGGWTAGAGIESPLRVFGLLGPNWTAKTEYLYVDLGRTTDVAVAAIGATFSTRTQEHIFRGGINYHFNAVAPSGR
jgi:outer membrane immunogenic protein